MHYGDRITPGILTYLRAGCGFGGSCLPKDIAALREFASERGVSSRLLDAVAEVNACRPQQLVQMAEDALGSLTGANIAVLGLAFKAGTDDLRDSPALAVIRLLEQKGAQVRAYDPLVAKLDGIRVCASAKEALTNADAAVIVTAWPEFAVFDWTALSAMMRRPLLIDGRNALRDAAIPESTTRVPIGRYYEPEGVALVS
jgi:nucleotide sugar dehydrogenase